MKNLSSLVFLSFGILIGTELPDNSAAGGAAILVMLAASLFSVGRAWDQRKRHG